MSVDVLIIGGGPAGLTAALTLARQNHTAILFDSREYRNSTAQHMHMIPTWDHRDPAQFRADARKEILQHYSTITIEETTLVKAEKINDSLFQVADSKTTWQGKKIILATGSGNIYPDIPGYEDAWTRRIFHCLFCHGHEDRGAASTGVLAVQSASLGPFAIHYAETAAQLSSAVTIYTHGSEELGNQLQTTLRSGAPDFKVDARTISRLTLVDNETAIKLDFADGSSTTETFLVHNPFTTVNGPFAAQLVVSILENGDIEASPPAYQTNVRGVFAAGDAITPYKVVPGALSSGCNASVAASAQLLAKFLCSDLICVE